MYECIDFTVEIYGGDSKNYIFWEGKSLGSQIDVHCTAGMGVRPKSDGYGCRLGGIEFFYLFSGRHK